MAIKEKNLYFEFADNIKDIKFDDNNYYRKRFNNIQESKAVDILAYGDKVFLFIEIKDFKGYEIQNYRRLKVNYNNDGEESLDYEVAKKVTMTLSCIFGAAMSGEERISRFFEKLVLKMNSGSKDIKINIILFLEGKFKNSTKTFKAITDSLKKKLCWLPLDTKILVENIEMHNKFDIFKVYRIKEEQDHK